MFVIFSILTYSSSPYTCTSRNVFDLEVWLVRIAPASRDLSWELEWTLIQFISSYEELEYGANSNYRSLEKEIVRRGIGKTLDELEALLLARKNRAKADENNQNRSNPAEFNRTQNRNQTSNGNSNGNRNSFNLERKGFYGLSDVRIQSIRNNQYKPKPYPGMGRTLRPAQASVMLREDVLECPTDPRPNAFVDMNTGVVRVYHGPVYGNPYSSIVPTQPMPVGSMPISNVPPFLAGPQSTYALNNRMYGGLAPMPGSQQAWGGPPDFQGQGRANGNNNGWGSGPGFATPNDWNNNWGHQNNWQGRGQGWNNGQGQNNGHGQNNSQGQNQNWQGRNQNSPNANQNNGQGSSRNNSPAQAKNSPAQKKNSPVQSNTAKVRNTPAANNNVKSPSNSGSPAVDNNGWVTVTPEQADDMATGAVPGSWGNNEQSGGNDWNAEDTSGDTTNGGGGWGDDNAGQTTGQDSGNGGDSWGGNDNADTLAQDNSGTSGWNQGSSSKPSKEVAASWGAVDLSKQSNDNSWGGDSGDAQPSSGNDNSWGGASGNDDWNAGANAQSSGTDSWGANTENKKPEGGNNGGGSAWGAVHNKGSGPVNYSGFGGVGAGSGGNSNNFGNWATDSGLSAGSWAEGTGPTLGPSNTKKTDGW